MGHKGIIISRVEDEAYRVLRGIRCKISEEIHWSGGW